VLIICFFKSIIIQKKIAGKITELDQNKREAGQINLKRKVPKLFRDSSRVACLSAVLGGNLLLYYYLLKKYRTNIGYQTFL